MTQKLSSVARYDFTIDAYLSDFRGKITLPMIGSFMLECATKHAEERNFGYSYMTSQKRAWVLSRMVIEFSEYPGNDSKFIIRTWVHDVNRLFTERRFAFENGDGKKIGYAKSLWASIDLETRRPTNVLELKSMVDYVDQTQNCPIDDMSRIRPLKDGGEKIGEFTVKYSDIDINKHLNSMKYIEHFVNVFPIDIFNKKDIHRFEINYVNEGLYGTSLDLVSKKADNIEEYTLEMRNGDISIASAIVQWE